MKIKKGLYNDKEYKNYNLFNFINEYIRLY